MHRTFSAIAGLVTGLAMPFAPIAAHPARQFNVVDEIIGQPVFGLPGINDVFRFDGFEKDACNRFIPDFA